MLLACWKDAVRFLGSKYMDIGKAVYHFAIPMDQLSSTENIRYGEILEEYKDGISSFDYEEIKAEQNIRT